MSKYKAVIFDLDGTLVNSLTDLANSVNKALSQVGLKTYETEDYKKFIGNGREVLLKRAMGDQRENKELFDRVYSIFDEEYKIHCNDNTTSYEGCLTLLKGLKDKGIKVGVLSNKPDEYIEGILNKIYPEIDFDIAWGKKADMPEKPDGTSLRKIIEILNLKQSECLYVGDSDVDVLTAQNAGVDMIGVLWGFRGKDELEKAGAKILVSEPNEILEYVNE